MTGGRARYALLAVVASIAAVGLGATSAQAMPAHVASAAAAPATDPPPTIDSQSTSNVGSQIATLDAQINPQGTDTTCEFQYVDDTDFKATGFTGPNVVTVLCNPQNLGSATSDVSATASITGLTPNTLYDFQAVATPTGGTAVDGGAAQFTTGPNVSIDSQFASAITPQGATLNAEINPEGNDTTCQFQYVDDTDFQATGFTGPNVVTTACSPSDLGSATSDQPATLVVTGLTPNTLYDFRAVATNSLTGTSGFDGPDTQFTTLPAVSVISESVTSITDTTATLHAQLNPNGLDTSYQFIVSGPGFNERVPSPKAVDIGSGTTDVGAEAEVTGLTPGKTYTYQVTATNSAGTSLGKPQTFTTFPTTQSSGIPDNRGFEMVSPANKDNGEPYLRAGQLLGPITSPPSGNALSWFSLNALPGSVFDGAFYVSSRGSGSWTTTAPIPPQATETSLLCATISPEAVGYSQDMSKTVLADGGNPQFCGGDNPPLVPGEPGGAQNLFVAGGGSPLLVDPNPMFGEAPQQATFDGASADLSTVVFDEPAQLTANAPGIPNPSPNTSEPDNLYASSPSAMPNPTVKLVTVLPDGTPVTGTLAGAGANTSAGSEGDAFGAVSSDGSKVFFTATPAGSTTTNLYTRENPLSSSARTVQLDSSIGGGGNFLAATRDGSEVFFSDSSGSNIYTCTFDATGNPVCDPVISSPPKGGAGIDGLAGVNPTGSDLYFVANGVLATNQNALGQSATSGQPNLYLITPSSNPATTTFIATLNGGDSNDWSPSSLASRVSSNGSFVAFTTTNALNTGSPTTTVPPQIYVYNANTNALDCGSCAAGGPPASAGASIRPPFTPVDFANGEFLQRYVSDSGQLFFDTPDALLPAVQNNGVSDVYEWEANGTGSCASAADNGGCLYLLSGGTNSAASFFADASPDGSNVFFVTNNALVPQDTDLAADFYDARVNGGFPATAPSPTCVGDGCKPPETPAPPLPVAATVTFSGPGNVTGSTSASSSSRARAAIAVLTHRLAGDRIEIRVTVPARGRLSIAGAGVKGSSRYVRRAGTYTLIARLKPQAMAAVATKHKLRLAIRVRYVPAAGRASAAVVYLTVKA